MDNDLRSDGGFKINSSTHIAYIRHFPFSSSLTIGFSPRIDEKKRDKRTGWLSKVSPKQPVALDRAGSFYARKSTRPVHFRSLLFHLPHSGSRDPRKNCDIGRFSDVRHASHGFDALI